MKSIERGSGNVYADLGYPDAPQMQIKALLATRISEIINRRELTQVQAAKILCLSQPKLSGMLRGTLRGISEAKMLDCLNRLGQDVEIIVRKSSRTKNTGSTNVTFV